MKSNVLAIILFAAATVIGVYGQDLAYSLNDWIPSIDPLTFLTILTIICITFFIASAIVVHVTTRKKNENYGAYFVIFSGIVVIGGVISVWSLLILASWWG